MFLGSLWQVGGQIYGPAPQHEVQTQGQTPPNLRKKSL